MSSPEDIDIRQQGYEMVVGLEVHVQLNTRTKLFCGCANRFGQPPNTQVCPVCLGLPGALPVLNRRVMDLAVMTALALGTQVRERLRLDRKNYFYPDLPKAYQISQFARPVGENGLVHFYCGPEEKTVRVKRLHIEEDAGKLMHEVKADGSSGVDYNRCGVPLLEIVSEPDMRTPEEAFAYLTQLKRTLLYLDISDCNMEEGSLRCDANVSVRPLGQAELGVKTEIKNMNSFRGVLKALGYEAVRQVQILKAGGRISQETRLWNADREMTFPMRSKEEAHDYRYFPEPDLVEFDIPAEQVRETARALPETPFARLQRFETQYKLPRYDCDVLTAERAVADYFEICAAVSEDAKIVSNWIMGDLLRELKETGQDIRRIKMTPHMLAEMIQMVRKGTINGKTAKDVFVEMFREGKGAAEIVREKGLVQITDEGAIAGIVREVIAANPGPVGDVRKGKVSAVGFLVGQVMRQSKGKANPQTVNELLKKELGL